jgi:hypothetical protein
MGSGGGPTALPPRLLELNHLDFYLWGHLRILVYAAPVDNEEACQTIRIYLSILERMRRPVMRRVEACMEYHGSNFEHLTINVLKFIVILRQTVGWLVCLGVKHQFGT